MATDISKSGGQIKVTEGSAKPRCYTRQEIRVYGFSNETTDQFILEFANRSAIKVLLASLTVAGAPVATQDAALTALEAVFV